VGCSLNVPELKSVRTVNGGITADYNVSSLDEIPPSSAKITSSSDEVKDVFKVDAPTLEANQQWTYLINDLNLTKTIKVLEAKHDYYIIKEFDDEVKYDKKMRILDVVYPPNKSYDKHWIKYNFPMYVGKNWEYDAYVKRECTGIIYKVHINSEVVSYGNVSVKAGVFKAFKINEQVNVLKSVSSSFYWYAPEVGSIIKTMPRSRLSFVQDIELISYTK
jgi:hypothetical protein